MPDEPTKPKAGRRQPASSRRALGGLAILVGLLLSALLYRGPHPLKEASLHPPRPSPSTAVAPVPPTEPSNASPTSTSRIVATTPAPAPRVLPASNAFTTLDDYRLRRASAMHSPEPMTPAPAGRTPETELGRVAMFVRDYRAAFGANPVGNNREIVRTLLGDNLRGTKFLDPATVSLNERGELLDAWGHPYFFHALGGTAMEIRSAGPDGKAYTVDDLVR